MEIVVDKTQKENIVYIDGHTGDDSPCVASNDDKKITLEKMFEFISTDLVLAQYTGIQDNIDEEIPLPKEVKADLRDYQNIGYSWIKTLENYKFGGILADDM